MGSVRQDTISLKNHTVYGIKKERKMSMSQANIPNITPTIAVTPGQSISLIVASIALEELALAHIINSEAEKFNFY